jgi:carboxymethylenebutenolidase
VTQGLIEEKVEIGTPDGTAGGFLYHPNGVSPGILFFTDIGGIRPAQQQMARRLGGGGLRCAFA